MSEISASIGNDRAALRKWLATWISPGYPEIRSLDISFTHETSQAHHWRFAQTTAG